MASNGDRGQSQSERGERQTIALTYRRLWLSDFGREAGVLELNQLEEKLVCLRSTPCEPVEGKITCQHRATRPTRRRARILVDKARGFGTDRLADDMRPLPPTTGMMDVDAFPMPMTSPSCWPVRENEKSESTPYATDLAPYASNKSSDMTVSWRVDVRASACQSMLGCSETHCGTQASRRRAGTDGCVNAAGLPDVQRRVWDDRQRKR